MTSNYLDARGWLKISGADAASFLQGMLTNDVLSLADGQIRYAALLSPQGKILFDFMVLRDQSDFLLDCPRPSIAALAKRLGFYKLRADVTILDMSDELGVKVGWGEPMPAGGAIDPRQKDLGWRLKADRMASADVDAYEAHRIKLGVPDGDRDFKYGESFPHEANMDLLHGIDFKKGCYVGQEVVSRVEHRGLARKRVVKLLFEGRPPAFGAPVKSGDVEIGTVGTASVGACLAMVRLDRLAKAGGKCAADDVQLWVDGPLPNYGGSH